MAPPLTALRVKIADPNWLMAWFLQPARIRQHRLMRRLRITVGEAEALTGYLYSGVPAHRPSPAWQGGDSRRGEALFVARGCRGCHAINPNDPPASTRAPHLAGIGIKVRPEWLFGWLKSPRAYDANTAMPQLVLSDDDIRHLVAFLMSHREGADVVAAAPRFKPGAASDAADAAIERFECSRCHLMNNVQEVARPTGWAVEPQACAGCHQPTTASPRPTGGATVGGADQSAIDIGRLLVTYYNCRGCHPIEGRGGLIAQYLERKTFAPPTLDGEGTRVQTSWLIDFLEHPTTLRPWLQARMPSFGFSPAEATALAHYFAALAHVAPADEPHDAAAPELITLGAQRFAHFKCVQCHPSSTEAPLPEGIDPEDLSINLKLAKTRLRPSWLHEFLARPKAVVGTETRMPAAFYSIDGVPKVEHPERDITAISAYLFEMKEGPEAIPTLPNAAGSGKQVDWSTYPY